MDKNNTYINNLGQDEFSEVEKIKLLFAMEENERSKLEYIASFSHELKNYLTGVMGFAQMAVNEIKDEETASKYLDRVLVNSKYMLPILNDAMTLSSLHNGKTQLRCESFNPKPMITEILNDLESQFAYKKINLMTSFDNFPVYADPKHFRQVIYNLLINAQKFSKDGGSIEVNSFCREGWYIFEVTDHGIGISKEYEKTIFKLFMQGDEHISGSHVGYGIGLSVCKQIIELHGGEISFTSEKGKGSTFRFNLPPQMVMIETTQNIK